jgi:hypothetical protein
MKTTLLTDYETNLYRLAKLSQSIGLKAFTDSQRNLQGELFIFSYPGNAGKTNLLEALAYGYVTVDSRAIFLPAFVDVSLGDAFSSYIGNIVTDTDAALNRLREFGIRPIKNVSMHPAESNKDYKKELSIARVVREIEMSQPEDIARLNIDQKTYHASGLSMNFYQPITENEPIEVQAILHDFSIILAGYATELTMQTGKGTKLNLCSHNPEKGYQPRDGFLKIEHTLCYSPEIKKPNSFQIITPLTRTR